MTRIITFQEDEEIIKLVDQVVEAQGTDRSAFIRDAIRRVLADLSYLPVDTKKALGMEAKAK